MISTFTLGVAAGLAYLIGLRGLALVLGTLCATFPARILVGVIARQIVAPSLMLDSSTAPAQADDGGRSETDGEAVGGVRTSGLKCPSCSRPLFKAAFVPFVCPHCGASIGLPQSYARVVVMVSATIAGLLAYGVGVRGAGLLLALLIGQFPPLSLIVLRVSVKVAPPAVTFTGDYRALLYTRDDDKPGSRNSRRK